MRAKRASHYTLICPFNSIAELQEQEPLHSRIRSVKMKKFIAVALTIGLLAGNLYAYGARGHRLVGAIADKRLAKPGNEAVRKRIKELLDGMTLEEVATLP